MRRWGPPAAPPLVLLHGFLGRSDDWTPVAERLGWNPNLAAVDLPGHGAACGLPARAYTMDGAADALADTLDWMLGASAILVGYSMGGRLALHLALRHPERVTGLVLIASSPGLRTDEEQMARRALDAERAREITADLPGFLDRWYRQPLFASLDDTTRARLIADRRDYNDPAELGRSLAGMGTGAQESLWEQLRSLRVPTWAVAGGRDAKFVALACQMAEAGPVTPVVLPGVGHAIPGEAPAALAALLRRLLRSRPREGGDPPLLRSPDP